MTEMKRSWLVQRLRKPLGGGQMTEAIESLSFGGGLRNGGLRDEAMTLIRGVFSFDYMGAAEFEFGAVPAALQTMDQRRLDLRASSIDIPLSQVATHWRKTASATPPNGQATVYLLAPGEWIEEVDRRVRRWAADGWQERLKESTRLSGALRPVEKWDSETHGWLELDNGFMFFVDEKMWRSCCALFGVRAEVSA